MHIWGFLMTEPLIKKRNAQPVHKRSTVHAPILCMALTFGAGAAQAESAWDMFVARCLDPYEHLTLAVTEGLQKQPIDPANETRQVFGPTPEGFLLVLDEAPNEGVRSCAVEWAGQEKTEEELAWRYDQLSEGLYVPDGEWLVSNEWIEPRVIVRIDTTDELTIYTVVETDLES